ncbi:MAG: type II toxin-antitoxin system RelE/ParE family toxin [Candidatus Magnetoovum sp. WYHC-5]|nr:type II toxin-antitoxin system RelE/ParE family toxin [Candidatus Magnetoovum sp. WYHC-5]
MSRRAQKALSNLNGETLKNVKRAIQSLKEKPRQDGSKKLIAREGWRICSGNYRIIYKIDDDKKEVTVLTIGHRRDVYRC